MKHLKTINEPDRVTVILQGNVGHKVQIEIMYEDKLNVRLIRAGYPSKMLVVDGITSSEFPSFCQ